MIGQGCEFDYSGVQAVKALKKEGYEVVLVNSNPATVMTDPERADRTYIEPLTVDTLHEVIRRERPDAVLPTLGGQTALNLAMELDKAGILRRYRVELIGAQAEAIARAEDRQLFKAAMRELGLDMPKSGSAHTLEEACAVAETIGTWPLIIRPGFTLGGTGGGIAHDADEFTRIVTGGLEASLNHEVMIEESLIGWKEFEMEVMADKAGNAVIVCSIENMDPMGVHTGDSITVAPIQTLTDREYQAMRDDSIAVLRKIGIATGGSNVQWAVDPKTGRRLVLTMSIGRPSQESREAGELMAAFYEKIGVKLELEFKTWNAFVTAVNEGRVQLFRMGWVGDYPDAQNFLQLFYSKNVNPGPNHANYVNPDFDREYDAALDARTTEERNVHWTKCQEIVREDCPWIFTHVNKAFSLVRPTVKNYRPTDFPYGVEKYYQPNEDVVH